MFLNGKKKKSGDIIHEINVTPLIDVSLTLVILLLLSTPLALESSIAVRKATDSAQAAEKKQTEERIELFVMSDDTIRVNRRIVTRRHLSETLGPLVQSSTSRLVLIDCSGTVSHGVFVDVLDQAKLCGAMEIAVRGK